MSLIPSQHACFPKSRSDQGNRRKTAIYEVCANRFGMPVTIEWADLPNAHSSGVLRPNMHSFHGCPLNVVLGSAGKPTRHPSTGARRPNGRYRDSCRIFMTSGPNFPRSYKCWRDVLMVTSQHVPSCTLTRRFAPINARFVYPSPLGQDLDPGCSGFNELNVWTSVCIVA